MRELILEGKDDAVRTLLNSWTVQLRREKESGLRLRGMMTVEESEVGNGNLN